VAEAPTSAFDCVLRAWREHESELRGFLARQTGDADAADDLLQDVFVKAMRQGQGFCVLDNSRAWLFQVARHAVVDAARAARPRAELSDELPAPAAPGRDAVDELDRCVARCLQTLDEVDRDIVQACDLDEQTVRVYAQSHGLSLAAAKSRLLRARQRLREALIAHCAVRFDGQGQVCCHVPAPRD
jgi:RNA polymerase sigma-70 factor (ECF subfamily)